MPISLDKLEAEAPQLVDLAKKAQINLTKHDLTGHCAKVALCLDYSGSMHDLYRSGAVQALAERVLALATQIDNDGAIDVFAFGSRAHYLGELTYTDFSGGVDRLTSNLEWGTTNYAAAIQAIRDHYRDHYRKSPRAGGLLGRFKKSTSVATTEKLLPAYVMFVTDGEPDCYRDATDALIEASVEPIFWQFMGIGNNNFAFLRRLDTLKDRAVDNAGFFTASDLAGMSDTNLYNKMLAEYPTWVSTARQIGWIK
jgi:hypothetical protein